MKARCGRHITVGVESIIGTRDPQAVSDYERKLAKLMRKAEPSADEP
jgi:hypothetical protein